jgi:hypothetical protein
MATLLGFIPGDVVVSNYLGDLQLQSKKRDVALHSTDVMREFPFPGVRSDTFRKGPCGPE